MFSSIFGRKVVVVVEVVGSGKLVVASVGTIGLGVEIFCSNVAGDFFIGYLKY